MRINAVLKIPNTVPSDFNSYFVQYRRFIFVPDVADGSYNPLGKLDGWIVLTLGRPSAQT